MPEKLTLHTDDGFALAATRFVPEEPAGKTVCINSATGVKQRFYTPFAEYLSLHGMRVYTYDYRGIGDSKPDRLAGFRASMADWGEKDQSTIIQYINRQHPQDNLILFGHSLGGQIIGLSPHSEAADKIILVASQTPFWKNYHGVTGFKVWLLWHVLIPFFTPIAGYFPASRLGLFEDLPAAAARQWARWGKTEKYMFAELPHKKAQFQSLRQPALIYSFDDDPFAPRKAVNDLIRFYPNMAVTHHHIFPRDLDVRAIGHWNFFRKPLGDFFWPSVLDWIRGKHPAPIARAQKATSPS